MIHPEVFYNMLQNQGIEFFSGVPDSLLKNICAYITDNTNQNNHIVAANEGGAVSICIGYHLATNKIPLIYLQNSGLGNIINPLLSLADADVYSIPMLIMIGWRGEPGIKDEPQHKKQGRVTKELLDSMEMAYEIITADMQEHEIDRILSSILCKIRDRNVPGALLIKKGAFNNYKLKKEKKFNKPMHREDAIKKVVSTMMDSDIIVSTTGVTSRELNEFREYEGCGHEKDFLTVGGMGHASHIALGIAMQKKGRNVYCLDGDGSFLMHMGSLAINGSMDCPNFIHIIFNNSAHDSVGGQPTVGDMIDIPRIALSCGYNWAKSASAVDEVEYCLNKISSINGPALLEIQVKKGFRDDLSRPKSTPIQNKVKFMEYIQG